MIADAQAVKQDTAVVVGLVAEFPRSLSQHVIHDPIPPGVPFGPNQAHTQIKGKKNGATKVKLRDHAAQRVLWTRT